jgi:predicted phosphodiesterase
MKGAKNLWTQVKEKFHEDVKRHYAQHGCIDVVIFSGDITQKSDPSEYQLAFDELSELWELFYELGAPPKLFIVPGNHDLIRPEGGSTLLSSLDAWRKRPANIESLLTRDDHSYRKEILAAFANYLSFVGKLRLSRIPVLMDNTGALPGDCSAVIEVNNMRIGFVGLNSAWSQLEQEKKEGDLEFSSEQIHHVVEKEITKWIAGNNINLLVTHHPVSWLTSEAQKEFLEEVNPLNRFDAHLFGHMHEHKAIGQEYSQKSRKKDIQVASLFGLEKASDGSIDRAHGYYFAKVKADDRQLLIWPRKAEPVVGGGWRINEDRYSLPDGDDFNSHTINVRGLPEESEKKK